MPLERMVWEPDDSGICKCCTESFNSGGFIGSFLKSLLPSRA